MKKRIFPNHKYGERFYYYWNEWVRKYPEDGKIRKRVGNVRQHRLQGNIEDLSRRLNEERFVSIQKIRFPYLFDGTCSNLSNRECAVVERTKNQFRLSKKFCVPKNFKEKTLEE